MKSESSPVEVSMALASARRRARLILAAEGGWSWHQLWFALPLAWGAYLLLGGPETFSDTTTGLLLVVFAAGGWQHQRLSARIEALTKLIADIGYPREA
jgi:hypothetical protein